MDRFLRFGIVGALGFLVDSGVLYLGIIRFELDLYTGRALSYLVAATFTWALNRAYTFRDRDNKSLLRQWGKFLVFNLSGGFVNYCVYAVLVTLFAVCRTYPVVAVAAGSATGLVVNFGFSRRFVFRPKSDTPTGDSSR